MSLSVNTRRAPAPLRTGAFPRIDLLPPEVKAAGRLRQTQTTLALLLVLMLAAVAAAIYWAVLQVDNANSRLAALQATSAEILAQQSEFADVPLVTAQITASRQAQQVGASTDVDVIKALNAILAPGDGRLAITALTFSEGTPVTAFDGNTNVFGESAVAQVTYSAAAERAGDLTKWIRGVDELGIVASTHIDSMTHEAGSPVWQMQGTIWFTPDVYSGRFQPADDVDDTATTDGEG